MEQLSGAEIIIRALQEEAVEYVWGYPGGAVLHIYDAFDKQDKISHILVRHEQAAGHAADGYARVTGKPGVVLVTSGPGATNVVTPLATAYMDSIPMVVISGQVPLPVIGSDAFQEVDNVGITRPCVKHNFLVKRVEDIAPTMKKAFHIATTGRPGPVLIDIPKDITSPEVKIDFEYPEKIEMRSYNPHVKGHSGQIQKAAKLIGQAKRPIIYSGGGAVLGKASEELREFTQGLGLPITQTLMGLGAYPMTDKQSVGMLGMHGTYEANMSMHESDLIIAIGARFDDRVTGNLEKFCPYAKIIHVDIDPSSISKNVAVDVPIVGEIKQVLPELLAAYEQQADKIDADALTDWWAQVDAWRAKKCLEYPTSDNIIKPQQVVEKAYEITEGKAIVTSDVGQHQMWAAQYYPFDEPNQWVNSGGLGTMGFGLPAAMGAKMAYPEREVLCVTGEGSIQMNIQELSTCLQYGLPVKILCLNNGYLGMVRQWQEFFYEKRYAMSYMESLPDFVALAESYGHVGINIEKPDQLDTKMREAFSHKDKLVFINVMTDPEENVYPMVPNGAGLSEMILV